MPAGPVMRPGAEAWHGGPSTWALGCVGGGGTEQGGGAGGFRDCHLLGRSVTVVDGERKILIHLRSGFDGFWLGSTPCLASDAAQSDAGWAKSERDTDGQPPACPKTLAGICPRSSKAAPLWVLFILR